MAVIVRHQSEDPIPNTGCAYSVRIDSQTAKCMSEAQYATYKEQKAAEAAELQRQSDALQPFVGGFIVLVLVIIFAVAYFDTA